MQRVTFYGPDWQLEVLITQCLHHLIRACQFKFHPFQAAVASVHSEKCQNMTNFIDPQFWLYLVIWILMILSYQSYFILNIFEIIWVENFWTK